MCEMDCFQEPDFFRKMNEMWKNIEGYEGLYQVSDSG